MAITYIYPETNEVVQKERWHWEAIYNDGTKLEQFELSPAGAIFHQLKEIDQKQLLLFKMVHNTLPPITLLFPFGAKLIHFYRHYRLRLGEPDEKHIKVYCFGYELGHEKHFIAIDSQDNIYTTNDIDRLVGE